MSATILQQDPEAAILEKALNLQETFPLMSGPFPLLSILAMYLIFVLKVGPSMMEHRKPYNLQTAIVVYNFIMVIYSIVLVAMPIFGGQLSTIATEYCKHEVRPEFEDLYMNSMLHGWLFFFSKIVELVDTVFFVLRKKQSQITFLHVYHHASTGLFVWLHNKYIPGPQGVIAATLNSTVHVFMYTYYMLSAMGPKYQKYTTWKKAVTWIQLVQFIIIFIYTSSLLLLGCSEPKATSLLFWSISLIFLVLFSNFYHKAYLKKKKQSQE